MTTSPSFPILMPQQLGLDGLGGAALPKGGLFLETVHDLPVRAPSICKNHQFRAQILTPTSRGPTQPQGQALHPRTH